MRTIAMILGTRPEAIKCAPVIAALRESEFFNCVVISTGQHREMLNDTLAEFDITPDIDLAVMTLGQTLSQVTSRILEGLAEPLRTLRPDAVIVHGDTATTFAGALAAFHHEIKVIHLEAGLRSGSIRSPFPEEANRRLVCQVADLHLAPTSGNAANLIREGVDESDIYVTGNTVIDALRWAADKTDDTVDPVLEELSTETRPIIVASAHRRECWGAPMQRIADGLVEIASRADVRIVVPVHRNPRVREVMMPTLSGHPRITTCDPLPYRAFCRLMRKADLVISDSSGAEEEGPGLGKPTLVLRDVTERPEAVTAGVAKLVSRDRDRIVQEALAILADRRRYEAMARASNVYGDGQATGRVMGALRHFFDDGPIVLPFVSGRREADVMLAAAGGA
ncbi:MAG: UDP-N-acetylglucosamine 2-epimerase (non-hydrolyzing) [Azospirillaceae bacterium]